MREKQRSSELMYTRPHPSSTKTDTSTVTTAQTGCEENSLCRVLGYRKDRSTQAAPWFAGFIIEQWIQSHDTSHTCIRITACRAEAHVTQPERRDSVT